MDIWKGTHGGHDLLLKIKKYGGPNDSGHFLIKWMIWLSLTTGMLMAGFPAFSRAAPVSVGYAVRFKVETVAEGCKKITDAAGRQLLLIPRQKPVPQPYRHLKVIRLPIRRVAMDSTIYAGLLRPLEALNCVVGVNAGKGNCYIPEMNERLTRGETVLLGNSLQIDYEKLKKLEPDLVWTSAWDKKMIPKLDELNIPVAVVGCFEEKHPLAKLEWIKFFAAFLCKDSEADRYFKRVEKRVLDIAAQVKAVKNKPKVLAGGVYSDKVHVPLAGSCSAELMTLCGGDYLFKNLHAIEFMGGYGQITMEEFYLRAQQADRYIFETSADYAVKSIDDLVARAELLAQVAVIQKEQVWSSQPWYWESIDKLDEIVADLAAVFHPALFPGHQYKYFYRIPAGFAPHVESLPMTENKKRKK